MEKPAQPKHKSKIMKFLPKATSAVSFQNPQFSPGKEKRSEAFKAASHAASGGRGFSGPMISIIPKEARGSGKYKHNGIFEEPTSPKISCMGQIKQKKKLHQSKKRVATTTTTTRSSSSQQTQKDPLKKELKKQTSTLRKIFGGRKSDASSDRPKKKKELLVPEKAPSLSQMRMFASGRDTFANFDWTAQIAPVDSDHHHGRNYYSDEERGSSDDDDDDDDEKEVIIPFSAPMMIGGGGLEPRKEINLWKRRTMAPPRPLQLKKI